MPRAIILCNLQAFSHNGQHRVAAMFSLLEEQKQLAVERAADQKGNPISEPKASIYPSVWKI